MTVAIRMNPLVTLLVTKPLRLYDDSSNTIKTYLGNSLEQDDKVYLVTSIVRTQVKNKDYETALANAKVLNASGRFQVQSLTLEAISTAKEGKAEDRGKRAHQCRQLIGAKPAVQPDAHQEGNRDGQHHHVVHEQVGRDQ